VRLTLSSQDLEARKAAGEALRPLRGTEQTAEEEKISAALLKVGEALGTESVTAGESLSLRIFDVPRAD
jgi:hypothetical protein